MLVRYPSIPQLPRRYRRAAIGFADQDNGSVLASESNEMLRQPTERQVCCVSDVAEECGGSGFLDSGIS